MSLRPDDLLEIFMANKSSQIPKKSAFYL